MHIIRTISSKSLFLLLILLILTSMGIVAIAQHARLETDLNEYMPSTHPAFSFSDESEKLFGITDRILIAIEHPDTIFNAGTLEKIRDISLDLPASFPEISDDGVTSLYTAYNITGSEWGMEVGSFYGPDIPSSAESLGFLREQVVSNEMIYGRNISKDTKASLIIAEVDPESDVQDLQKRLINYAESWEGPETLYIAGRPIVEGALAQLGPADMARMFPMVMIVMITVLLILLRSVRDMILNMVIVLVGIVAAFAGMVIAGVPVYAVDTMIPVMLIAIGVAYGIHMHNAIHHEVLKNPDIGKQELVDAVLKAMVRPVFMAALTTAIGFMALMTSQVLPVRYFGLFSSIGVMTEMLLALVLFPASIYLFGVPRTGLTAKTTSAQQPMVRMKRNRWGQFQMRKPGVSIGIALVCTALGIAGTMNVWIDTSFLANFEKDSDIVRTDTFVNTHFGGTSSLNVILSADREQAFKDPEVLQAMDMLQRNVLEQEVVGNAFSLTDFIKRMHKVMHADDKSYSLVPDSQELIAQYLLLYEFSGDPETLESVIDYEYRNANITFQLKSDSSAVMSEIIGIIENHEERFEELGISLKYAGSGYKAFVFSELLLQGQVASLLLSFVIVAILLAMLFKSIWIGMIGTVPIAITAIINFGIMGVFDIPLSSATALISSIAVGIGVDYAIHLIEHYRNRRLEGNTIEEATFSSIRHTGRAIIYNALAVMGGFAVLMLSVFPPNRQVGTLIVLNMATSALGTLSVLLVAIIALDKRGLFIRTDKTSISHEITSQEESIV